MNDAINECPAIERRFSKVIKMFGRRLHYCTKYLDMPIRVNYFVYGWEQPLERLQISEDVLFDLQEADEDKLKETQLYRILRDMLID